MFVGTSGPEKMAASWWPIFGVMTSLLTHSSLSYSNIIANTGEWAANTTLIYTRYHHCFLVISIAPTLLSLSLVPRPLPVFQCCTHWKTGSGLGTRLVVTMGNTSKAMQQNTHCYECLYTVLQRKSKICYGEPIIQILLPDNYFSCDWDLQPSINVWIIRSM